MTSDLFGLEGKRILVLGGGQGIGEATVNILSQLGCHTVVADREQQRAEAVAAAVTSNKVTSIPVGVDVLDDQALVDAIAAIDGDVGALDGMVAVIGMAAWSPLLDMELDTWDQDHQRNLRYFFVAAREVARCWQRQGRSGSIVSVSSVSGTRSAPLHAAYGAAKAGLVNLAKTMAAEWSDFGIRVNVVAPGAVVTPRIPFRGEEEERHMMANVPMKRRATTDEIAHAITFFLSDMSSYITGQTLAVDGGFSAVNAFSLKMPSTGSGSTLG